MSSSEIEGTTLPAGYFRAQGYAWYAYPTTDTAPDSPFESYRPNCEPRRRDVVFFGSLDVVTGLVNQQRDGGHLCLTSYEGSPPVLDGWEVEPAELDFNFEAKGLGTIRLVREIEARDPDLEPFHQYEIEGWD